jgi:signal transduction histidine kinase
VLWNLVHNAIKFTPAHGRVEIRVHRDDEQMEITVQDNGQGISSSFLPHVFERFRQQDASTTRAAFGLGLGLSIARHLIELHGAGATFSVRLPCRAAPSKEEAPPGWLIANG